MQRRHALNVRLAWGNKMPPHLLMPEASLFHERLLPGAILQLLSATVARCLAAIPVFFPAQWSRLTASSKNCANRIEMAYADVDAEAFSQGLLHNTAWSLCIHLRGVFEPQAYRERYLVGVSVPAVL